MDTNAAHPDDLNPLERRLAAWPPAAEGLDPAAMLFAAGRAAARRGKAGLAWPVVSACLTLVVLALGIRLAVERSERLRLHTELANRQGVPPLPAAPVPEATPATDALPPDGYLVLRREWEQYPGGGASHAAVPQPTPPHPAAPELPILRAWQPDGPPEPL